MQAQEFFKQVLMKSQNIQAYQIRGGFGMGTTQGKCKKNSTV